MIYDNDTPNVYLASFAKFMSKNNDQLYIRKLVFDAFDEFIIKHVQKYEGHTTLPIHFVGSVAYYFKDILKLALDMKNLTLGQVIKKPIDNLVSFHKKQ